ncbi:hypothetical protein [Microcoleus sp. D2_18a_D3]|uniref:hypothetical protein n=1 Tax=Microcoleus sp. D2_18a_D3 TaxID=3055330 RepID=UPI002FD2F899
MNITRIICWQFDSTLRPTMKRGFDIIIPAQSELISNKAKTFELKTIIRNQVFFETAFKITGIIFPSTATHCGGINSLNFKR